MQAQADNMCQRPWSLGPPDPLLLEEQKEVDKQLFPRSASGVLMLVILLLIRCLIRWS